MTGKKLNEDKTNESSKMDVSWIYWFEMMKKNQPDKWTWFFKMISEFVRRYPQDARHLTVETIHGILLEEI